MHVLGWMGLGDDARRQRQIARLGQALEELATHCRRIEDHLESLVQPAERRRMQVRLDVARRQYRKGLRRLHELESND